MSDHFLSKLKVANDDFVEAGGQSALEQYAALQELLTEHAGPEVAAMFAEPLISRGNDAAPPTVSWYTSLAGEARPLDRLPPLERDRIERYLSEHLRPVRALAEADRGGLAMGALTTYGASDVLVVDGRPVIQNWGLMPGGGGANAAARPAHYGATLGRFLPLGVGAAASAMPASTSAKPPPRQTPPPPPVAAPARLTPLAWVPLVVLLVLAAGTLAWLLIPGNRLFPAPEATAVTDADRLAAARAETAALVARRGQLQDQLAGAMCRADGQLILPGGLTPEGLTPPPLGQVPPDRADAAPDATLPSRPTRVVVPDGDGAETTLLAHLEARTVLVIADGATGSGLSLGNGLIVTNNHVIDSGTGDVFIVGAALQAPQRATVVKTTGPLDQTGGDFALLRIDDSTLPAFDFYRAPGSLALTNVVAAGFPGDVLETDARFAALRQGDVGAVPPLTVTDGIVNTEQQLGSRTNVLMHSAALSTGNSGGPLVDMCGRVVGVNTFVRKGTMQNRGFALATGDLLDFLSGTEAVPQLADAPCAPVVLRPALAGVTPAPQD
ncbi:trypsin-like peptidase domain-containing protein [Arenibacterium halophilum]|uniref:Trypsin-like peptidase domain-containing protein n=1 Tax=Arenibacterium halophilum TaxID=2583821 RepID=A0ABY2X8N7_9RHOB|nr:trypsin-like peptidase domain-containing protein [Arenibacterium halophilum]TMV12735.1 trypsin-like peptidase domain-containing protein [Arenibacterium halophilum]